MKYLLYVIAGFMFCGCKVSTEVSNIESNPIEDTLPPESDETPTSDPPLSCAIPDVQSVGLISPTNGGAGQSLRVAGDYAYMGMSSDDGVQIFDISDPEVPVLGGYFTLESGPGKIDAGSNLVTSIEHDDNYLYLSTYWGGLVILDVSDKSNPIFVSAMDFTQTWGVRKFGDTLVLADSNGGLVRMIDVSDPFNPSQIASFSSVGGHIRHIDIDHESGVAYIAMQAGLGIYDINTPSSPSLLGSLTSSFNYAYYPVRTNGYLFLADKGDRNMATIDISDLSTPQVVNTTPSSSDDYRVVVAKGNYIFVGASASNNYLHTYDVTDPLNPNLIDTINTNDRIYEMEIKGNYIYAGEVGSNMEVFKVCP